MSLTIILNSNNVVNNGLNTQFTYAFPQGGFKIEKDAEMCISNLTIPYSWYNVNAQYYNNASFSYNFPDANGDMITFNVNLPNGYYTTADINQYLQTQFISNNQYLVNADGQYVYYMEMITNPTYYAIQVICYALPTSLPSGYTNPAYMAFPPTTKTPQLVILNNNFGNLIGYSSGSYPTTPQTSNQSFLSNGVPNATPVNSLILRTNLVDNPVSMPSDILDSIPITSEFGFNITYEPTFGKFIKIKKGNYAFMTLTIYDQNLNPVPARDPNSLITLLLRFHNTDNDK